MKQIIKEFLDEVIWGREDERGPNDSACFHPEGLQTLCEELVQHVQEKSATIETVRQIKMCGGKSINGSLLDFTEATGYNYDTFGDSFCNRVALFYPQIQLFPPNLTFAQRLEIGHVPVSYTANHTLTYRRGKLEVTYD